MNLSELQQHGFVLHPLKGKIPVMKKWQELTSTPADIEKHVEAGGNVGAVCGKASNITAIDFDSFLFADEIFSGKIDTLCAERTEGRGHVYFKYNEQLPASKHHDLGIEVLSDGNNIVLPGSKHPSGDIYHWKNPDAPILDIPVEVEANLSRLFKTETELKRILAKCRRCFRDVIKRKPDMHGSSGREMMLAVCTDLKANGAEEQHIKMFAKLMYREKFDEGRTMQEWRNIDPTKTWTCETLKAKLPAYVDLAECEKCDERRTAFQNRPDLQAPTITDPPDFTDVGNAKRLVATYGDKIRYCHPWKSWLCWNGKFWERDNTGQIFRYAKDTAKAMLTEAESMTGEMREKMRKHGMATKSLTKLKAMVTLAESEPEITILPNELDKDIWLINLQNGTLNLKIGQLQEHKREDFMTKISPVTFDASATCERWLTFLNRIFESNASVIEYVQKITGQCLTGDASEEQLFIFWGKGANGKSTLIETLAYILGDYSKTIGIESLMKKERSSISNDIARLKGARFVSANEPEFGDHISEGKVKNLTGKDTIQARFLFQENFEFKPEYKLIISTNHKPIIKGMDHGIWRRIKLVPFNITIPEAERDKGLDVKLQGEASGILNWLLCGCMAWQQNGLSVPQEVVEATEDFKFEMDSMSDFFQLCCIADMSATTPSKIIYLLYRIWARASDIKPVSNKAFTQMCIERGFKAIHKNYGSAIQFIRIPGWGIDLHEKYITGTSEKECILELQKQLDNNIGDIIKSNVSLAEKAVHILKKEYDKFTKPDREDIDRLRRTMLTKLFLEIGEIDQIHAEKVIDDYFQVRQW